MHGDIKPQNVLVFDGEEGKGEYLAKVADFGYSGMLMVDAVRVTVHGTEGWAAPEYTKGMSADFEAARRIDVFSLGWLCLWLLFYNRSENETGGTTSDFLAHRRSKTSLVDIASEHIESSEGIDDETRKNLTSFFQRSLQHDPALRVVDCQTLLGLIAPHRCVHIRSR
jgi:serine/threonine protein kinase